MGSAARLRAADPVAVTAGVRGRPRGGSRAHGGAVPLLVLVRASVPARSSASRGVLVLQISSRRPEVEGEAVEERGAGVAAREPQRIGDAREALRRKESIHDGSLSGWMEGGCLGAGRAAGGDVVPQHDGTKAGDARSAPRSGAGAATDHAREAGRVLPCGGQMAVWARPLSRRRRSRSPSERTNRTTIWVVIPVGFICIIGDLLSRLQTRRVTLARFAGSRVKRSRRFGDRIACRAGRASTAIRAMPRPACGRSTGRRARSGSVWR